MDISPFEAARFGTIKHCVSNVGNLVCTYLYNNVITAIDLQCDQIFEIFW